LITIGEFGNAHNDVISAHAHLLFVNLSAKPPLLSLREP